MKSLFATLIVLVALVTVVIGAPLIFEPDTGGFLSGAGVALGLIVLGAGNLLVLILNLAFQRFYGAPRWLRVLIYVQLIPAGASLVLLATQIYGNWQESQAADQHLALSNAIKSDDVGAFAKAQQQCDKRCSDGYSRNVQLLDAANARAEKVAAALIGQHAVISSKLGRATLSLRTCEGDTLSDLDALSVAVARHDAPLVDTLFPASDQGARRRAMWLAARLDRLDLVQALAAKGVPLNLRGPVLNENDTLLVAAASGAALEVGKWLIETQSMPVDAIQQGPDPYPGLAPLRALMLFQSSVPNSPRIGPFLRMLAAHGAHLDEPGPNGRTPMQDAIADGDKRAAQLLLGAGAGRASLSEADQKALSALLARPDGPTHPPKPTPGCVAP